MNKFLLTILADRFHETMKAFGQYEGRVVVLIARRSAQGPTQLRSALTRPVYAVRASSIDTPGYAAVASSCACARIAHARPRAVMAGSTGTALPGSLPFPALSVSLPAEDLALGEAG